ncbi:hypothetical protein MARCHEWKA_02320 [Brevundimonas phage vB_BpoS-Marchewka]|uniref:Uncharacterized protein n=1 Tax=Brevundimonas phage vB_BpoS-Marchewka TaxID=2948604 RepID=A0A9E7SR47_9CAUD|nr:hypothetical protein MARCHEWKA_02320 [Brevundimonas phage vB_BpoS-Marchewka]
MSAFIKLIAQRRNGAGLWEPVGFTPEWTSYAIYGVLANQRNYAEAPFITEARYLPSDWPAEPPYEMGRFGEWTAWADAYDLGDGVKSWLTLTELLAFDYDQTFTNLREGGQIMTVREHLGDDFFTDLHQMQAMGVERIVFRIG